MFISAKAYFDDKTPLNDRLLIRAETEIPAEWAKRYRKNVVQITPRKTGALRRSIITQVVSGRAQIGWRSAYAAAQNQGGHTVPRPVSGPNRRDGGFATIAPGFYRYRRYTTPGTGPRFASIAFRKTNEELPLIYREVGFK